MYVHFFQFVSKNKLFMAKRKMSEFQQNEEKFFFIKYMWPRNSDFFHFASKCFVFCSTKMEKIKSLRKRILTFFSFCGQKVFYLLWKNENKSYNSEIIFFFAIYCFCFFPKGKCSNKKVTILFCLLNFVSFFFFLPFCVKNIFDTMK